MEILEQWDSQGPHRLVVDEWGHLRVEWRVRDRWRPCNMEAHLPPWNDEEQGDSVANRMIDISCADGKALRLAVWQTSGSVTPTTYSIPAPASFAWADPEPFPEEKEELKPAYLQGYMERRKSWTEKWNAFKARWF